MFLCGVYLFDFFCCFDFGEAMFALNNIQKLPQKDKRKKRRSIGRGRRRKSARRKIESNRMWTGSGRRRPHTTPTPATVGIYLRPFFNSATITVDTFQPCRRKNRPLKSVAKPRSTDPNDRVCHFLLPTTASSARVARRWLFLFFMNMGYALTHAASSFVHVRDQSFILDISAFAQLL